MDAGASAADGGRLRFDYVVDDLNKPKNNKISTTGTPVLKPRLSPELRGFGSPSTRAGANRISAVNELAYERSAQRNVALMYASAPNSRADIFTLMQLRMYSAGIRGPDRFAQTVKGRFASINMENFK
jgi:hypothetical protein